ncbi:hypothetical protein [Streptomyces sp. NL15-2K]|uniref:hypothetical protein n=1 Tax=Streptomyces sp. NL15-2K TaxID=376149 RepID=UPI000F560607|nr:MULTISPECIES: hypothetical protein [Actinomycetes]WKX13067.1 hypothetical protein Q4V64_38300 [Kutzneria buriramensis]
MDEEIARFLRVLRWTNEVEWVCPVVTVTALLDLASELWADQREGLVPISFREKVDRASGGSDQTEYLNTLAGVLRAVDRELPREFDRLAMSDWESEVHFGKLLGFYKNWVNLGEYETFEDSVAAAIDSEHPFCAEHLGPLSAEAQRALVMNLQSPELAADAARVMPWTTTEELAQLLSLINDHMRHAHETARL